MTPNSFGAVVVPRVWIENLFSDVDYRAWTIFTAMTIVAVGAFIWAAFVRKRRVDPHFHPMPPGREKSAMHGPAWSLIRLWKRKSNRRRRRSHWPGPPTWPSAPVPQPLLSASRLRLQRLQTRARCGRARHVRLILT